MSRLALSLIALAVGACATAEGAATVDVEHARIGAPAGPHAAAYLTLHSDRDDRLVGVSTDVAGEVQIHATVETDDGAVGMQALEAIPIDAHEALVLEPGGTHLMLMNVGEVEVGDSVTLKLELEQVGVVVVTAAVVEPAEVLR